MENNKNFLKRSLKHVIFDWSGTLYDDHKASFKATKECFKALGGPSITYKEYKEHFVLPVMPFYRRYGFKQNLKQINHAYFSIYQNHYHKGELFKGVLESLKFLKSKNVTMSVFSTLDQNQLDDLCDRHGLRSYFTQVTGSVCDKRKEFARHLKSVKCQSQKILYIGDMAHDVEAAHCHNLMAGAVMNGYQNEDLLLKAKPHFVWTDQKDWPLFFKAFLKPTPQKKAKPRVVATAGALVVNSKKQVLLVHTPKWGFTYGIPGGKAEKGETMIQTCVRELLEETGLKIVVKDLLCVQDCIDSSEFYVPQSHFLLFNYWATTSSTKVQLNDEALSYLWIDPKLALNLNLNKPTRILLADYLKFKERHP